VAVEQPGVADLLVRCLVREGVTVVFGIPGEENIRFTDALARSSIRYVLVRHEQAASFMAEIYGRVTGRAGAPAQPAVQDAAQGLGVRPTVLPVLGLATAPGQCRLGQLKVFLTDDRIRTSSVRWRLHT